MMVIGATAPQVHRYDLLCDVNLAFGNIWRLDRVEIQRGHHPTDLEERVATVVWDNQVLECQLLEVRTVDESIPHVLCHREEGFFCQTHGYHSDGLAVGGG